MAKVILHPAVAQYKPSGVGQNAPVDRQSIYTERSKQTDVEALHEQTEERVKQGQELDFYRLRTGSVYIRKDEGEVTSASGTVWWLTARDSARIEQL